MLLYKSTAINKHKSRGKIYIKMTDCAPLIDCCCCNIHLCYRGGRWLSGRASDSGARRRGLETYLRRVVSLSKILYSPKVPVIHRKRWLRPDTTGKLLIGTLSLNTNKQMSRVMRKPTYWFPTWSDTNQAVQLQKMA